MEIMLWWDHLGCNLQGCFCLCVSTDLTRVFSYFSNSAKVHFPGSDRFWSLHFVFSLSSWLIFLKQARWTLHSGMFNRWPSHPKVAPRAAPWRNLCALGPSSQEWSGSAAKTEHLCAGKTSSSRQMWKSHPWGGCYQLTAQTSVGVKVLFPFYRPLE